MKNHRKLLLAGLAIVPLALSSWSSKNNDFTHNKSDYNKSLFSMEDISGKKDVIISRATDRNSKVVTKKVLDNSSSLETFSEKILNDGLDPSFSIDKIVENYK